MIAKICEKINSLEWCVNDDERENVLEAICSLRTSFLKKGDMRELPYAKRTPVLLKHLEVLRPFSCDINKQSMRTLLIDRSPFYINNILFYVLAISF